jgi:hypothetical protein
VINIEQIGLLGAEYFVGGDPMAIQDMSQATNSKTQRSWQEIAREVTQEQDPTKVRKLSAELNQAMLDEERRRVRLRFRC